MAKFSEPRRSSPVDTTTPSSEVGPVFSSVILRGGEIQHQIARAKRQSVDGLDVEAVGRLARAVAVQRGDRWRTADTAEADSAAPLKLMRRTRGCTFGSQVVIVPPAPLNTRLAIWLGSAIWPIWSSVSMSK